MFDNKTQGRRAIPSVSLDYIKVQSPLISY
nr:MAG TPA: hypothetical protein [Caudoviricetes sp.]